MPQHGHRRAPGAPFSSQDGASLSAEAPEFPTFRPPGTGFNGRINTNIPDPFQTQELAAAHNQHPSDIEEDFEGGDDDIEEDGDEEIDEDDENEPEDDDNIAEEFGTIPFFIPSKYIYINYFPAVFQLSNSLTNFDQTNMSPLQ